MRKRIAKITALALLSVAFAVLVVVAAFYVRLSRGPVSLNFMTETVESRINANLKGMAIDIGGVVIERPPGDDLPRLRLADLELRDDGGNLIARAPRAAIGVDEAELWTGSVVPRTLELIGPHILIKRSLDGGLELGFGADGGNADTSAETPGEASGKSDKQADSGGVMPDVRGDALLKVLSGGTDNAEGGLGTVEDIRVSGASIVLYDEPNNAIWNAPQADLAFKRMPYGFVVVTTASVANGSEPGVWHTEMSASYRRESKSFSVSARIFDLVPASISEKIFALAQFARVKIPLSGHAEFEITQQGTLNKASVEFAAAAGEVGFPDYLADPMIVDEGSLRADYDPASGAILIRDSSLLVGGSRAELSGTVTPLRSPDGRLTSLDISLAARNVSIDAQGTVVSPVAVDRVDFKGNAGIAEAKLEIDDLVIMSGNTGVRMRGTITRGNDSSGLLLSGRIRGLSSELLKKLWPPILAPKTRTWVNQYVRAGSISDGSFQVNLPIDALARAKRERRLPPGSFDLRFTMDNVKTGYFKDLPPIEGASGEARLLDNDFTLKMAGGTIVLDSGEKLKITSGDLRAESILAVETIGNFSIAGTSKFQALIEYLTHPTLSLVNSSGLDTSHMSGKVDVNLSLSLPFIKDVPRDRVVLTAKAQISDFAVKGALDKVDLSGGAFDLTLDKDALDASGSALLNGMKAEIKWHRDPGKGGRQSAEIAATFDDEDRKKLGVDLSGMVSGPVSLAAVIADIGDKTKPVKVKANLSKAEMHIAAINWSRGPTPDTTATFNYFGGGEGGRRVEDLVIAGDGLSIKGDIALKPDGSMKEANLPTVVLGSDNVFSMKVKPTDTGNAIFISGKEFDAKPLIRNLFSAGSGGSLATPTTVTINAEVERVYAFRGEEVRNVQANILSSGGVVRSADITGTFVSGQPIVLRVKPKEKARRLQVTGRDAGAALRAANLYSKVAGGELNFSAGLVGDTKSRVRNGLLVIRDFEVRNEAALAELDQRGKPKQSGPRTGGIQFRSLKLPFTADEQFVRIGDSLAKGPELGVIASGIIRKSDSAVDIVGTIIPAYALNSAVGDIPIIGSILTGGKGEGIIGITFALGGTFDTPQFQVNPVSAVAPGFLRKLFEYQKAGGNSKPPQPNSGSNK